jgi:hypothetical protein
MQLGAATNLLDSALEHLVLVERLVTKEEHGVFVDCATDRTDVVLREFDIHLETEGFDGKPGQRLKFHSHRRSFIPT